MKTGLSRETAPRHNASTGSSRNSSHYSPLSVSPNLSPRGAPLSPLGNSWYKLLWGCFHCYFASSRLQPSRLGPHSSLHKSFDSNRQQLLWRLRCWPKKKRRRLSEWRYSCFETGKIIFVRMSTVLGLFLLLVYTTVSCKNTPLSRGRIDPDFFPDLLCCVMAFKIVSSSYQVLPVTTWSFVSGLIYKNYGKTVSLIRYAILDVFQPVSQNKVCLFIDPCIDVSNSQNFYALCNRKIGWVTTEF